VDDSYSLLFETEVYTFLSLYQDAYVYAHYKPEDEVFQDLLHDSTSFAVVSRELTKDELDYFAAKSRYPKTIKIAEDGIAFIVNNKNSDTVISQQNMDKILSGNLKDWSELQTNSSLGKLNIAIDHKNSANAHYIAKNFLKGNSFPAHFMAADKPMEVVDYVMKNEGAIGVISSGWIADAQDSTVKFIRSNVKLVYIQANKDTGGVLPLQGYIKSKEYPYTRSVYVINAEGGNGLASGFTAFVASEKGQLIILKSGMVPATTPARTINITKDSK
jgi:phosphate transport system substrate-binding protein